MPPGINFKRNVPHCFIVLLQTYGIKKFTGGITITDIKSSDIEQRIREKVKEGLDDEYVHMVKELEKFFYPEDIAAAAIMLYIGDGGRDEVRRRTLNKAPFIPLRTKESVWRSTKRLPAVQPQSRPAVQGTPRRSPPAAQSQPRPAGYGAPHRSQQAPQSHSRPAPQGTPRRSPPHAARQRLRATSSKGIRAKEVKPTARAAAKAPLSKNPSRRSQERPSANSAV